MNNIGQQVFFYTTSAVILSLGVLFSIILIRIIQMINQVKRSLDKTKEALRVAEVIKSGTKAVFLSLIKRILDNQKEGGEDNG